MKVITKLRGVLILLLLGWASMAQAAYPSAPTLNTSGSAAYTSIATAINSWKNAWSPDRGAYNNRSTIIDNVEATLLAAGKATITDTEYDVLADGLYWWLHQVVVEGSAAGDNRGGWYISGIAIPEWYFSDGSTLNCVWELTQASVPIAGGGENGYGPMLGDNVRMVLITNLTESTIVRGSELCNVMFSTNGENSKLLVLGRKNNKISFSGGKNFPEPTSYNDVLNHAEELTSTTGNEVIMNGGSLLTAYTSFRQNVATAAYCNYREYSTVPHQTDVNGNEIGGTRVSNADGGAVGVMGKVNQIALYKTDFKNNAINVAQTSAYFGGGMSLRNISSIVDGVYMNKCSFKGNYNQGHGGGLSGYFDGGDSSEKMIIRDTEFAYNCQAGDEEVHGGAIFYRDTGRETELYNCTFTNNYAHGSTAGGAGVSTEGHILLKGCTFDQNYSDNAFGGAIYTRPVFDNAYTSKVVDLKIDGCTFTNNQCVWTHDNETAVVSRLSSNIERGSGGAIMVDIFHGTSDADSTVYDISVNIFGNSVFTNNSADRNGGAVAVVMMGDMKLWAPTHTDQIISNLKITSATINGNHVTDVAVPVYTYTDTEGQTVTGVTKNGGAIYLAHTTLTMEGGTVGSSSSPNYAVLGGGAYINDANMNMTGGQIQYNNASQQGGGFYLENGNFYISGGSTYVNNNSATQNGGGGYVNSGYVHQDGGQIYDNTAVNGAGMYVNGGKYYLENGYIHGNDASNYGGGVYMNGGSFYHYSGEVGRSYENPNTAVNGAGVYMNGGNYSMWGGFNNGNAATADGGGVYMNMGDFILRGGTIGFGASTGKNSAVDGAGVYMKGGTFQMKAGYLRGNYASRNGGGVYSTGGTCTVTGGRIGTNASSHNEAEGFGGGIYSAGGVVTIDNDSTAVYINYNKATNGAGIYTSTGGSITIEKTISSRAVEIRGNDAAADGGGVYAGGAITMSGGNILLNKSGNRGGGVFVDGGTFILNDGVIGGTTAQGNYTTAEGSMGGGVFMNSGTATLSGGSISGNHTYTGASDLTNAGKGGGVYMFGGTCTLSGGATIGGNTDEYANSSDLGGGIHSAAGIITVKGGKIQHNAAVIAGGGIYTNGASGVVNVEKEGTKATLSYIEYNTAQEGGGIYANRGTVNFSDGNIQYNHASEAGGGIYVNFNSSTDFGTLNLRGNAVLASNRVPAGKKGGGVYLKGRVFVGEETSGGTGSSVKAETNYADAEGATITNANRNNIYLPNPEVRDDHCGLITVNEGGINTLSSVGFSVETNRVPVIYCAYSPTSYTYLDLFTTGPESHTYQNVLFDDSQRYISVHYTIYPRDRFDYDHVYLFGFWPEEVTTEPSGFSLDNIDSERDLAWLISVVNGRTDNQGHVLLEPNDLAGQTINLNADLNMEMLGWVPIGTTTKPNKDDKPFKGTFNGNGHTITGIGGMVYKDHYAYGLFGNIEDATIQDVFVKDAEFYLEENDTLVVGGLVGEIYGNSTVCNSEASSLLVAVSPKTTMGGLIGRQNAGTVHSTCAIPEMHGGHMGGLVGQLVGGNLYNSFTNVLFTPIATSTQYWGGLVAENNGNVENCYLRMRNTTLPTEEHFGLLVGQNQSSGSLKYCYSLEKGSSRYYADKASGSTFTDYRYYDDNTEAPYLYAQRDNQVHVVEGASTYIPAEYGANVNPNLTTTSDKQMMLCLNNWVTAKNTAGGDYTYWSRPTTKLINNDLPVLKMPISEAIAATSGDPYLAYGGVNTLLGTYTAASQALWLYKSLSGLNSNDGSAAPLYIAEGLAVVPEDGATVNAYVGVTLRNTAGVNGANPTFGDGTPDYTDWHMFSSPLTNAPLGVDYNGDETQYLFSYSHSVDAGGNPMPYYHFYDDDDARGFFPSHRYGTTYDGSVLNSETAGGNYYKEWDFYTYYEPEYHWINFKRNSNSHWHENAHDVQIEYNNEDELTQGRGYLFATREETFLQCQGQLANDEVYIDVTRSGYYSPGYNFLGNPYLAYLDFNAFARENEWIWGGYSNASYAIIDEVNGGTGGYTYYATEASVNPALATRFIAPMQGFMVLAVEGDEAEFNTSMRTITDTIGDSHFRGGDKPAYPLVNLFAFDDNNNRDITTVELGRPDQGGAKIMRDLKQAKCHVYCHYENEDWAIAFTKPGLSEAAIRFEAYADGEYTMKWDTQNGDFSYLHLIDNITGADIDCLSATEYRFTASTSDYRSRFRLVFGYTGVEEETDETQNTSFAFQSGDELVITGEGTLTMFDVTGRAVMKTETHGTQTAAPLPNLAAGVYLLQLDAANGTKVQKIVIK